MNRNAFINAAVAPHDSLITFGARFTSRKADFDLKPHKEIKVLK